MAGGFGGDDEEFEGYEPEDDDEEELDEDEDGEDGSDESEDSEEGSEDEESEEGSEGEDEEGEDSDDPIERQNALQKKIFEAEEKFLKPKLFTLDQKLTVSSKFLLNPLESRNFKKAKKHPKLKSDVTKIEAKLIANKVKMTSKVMSSIAPAIPAILKASLILFLVIAVIVIIASIIPSWLFEKMFGFKLDPGEGAGGGASAEFGIKGDSFYGMRMVYRDDTLAISEQLASYLDAVTGEVNKLIELETISFDAGDGSGTTTYNLVVTYTEQALLEEGFEFNRETFASEYVELNNILTEIAGMNYSADKGEEGSSLTLDEKLSAIDYFGLNETLKTDVDFNKLIDDYIKANYEFVLTKDSSTIEDASIREKAKAEIDTIIDNSNVDDSHFVRTEKLFVKDYILKSSDDVVRNIENKNYVAMIYLPKESVTFTEFSYYVSGVNLDDFDIKMHNGDSQVSLPRDSSNDMAGDEDSAYFYKTKSNISASATTLVDATNETTLSVLSGGVSFGKLSTLVGDKKDIYLKSATDDSGFNYFTYNTSGVYLTFSQETRTEFTFWEWETKYN